MNHDIEQLMANPLWKHAFKIHQKAQNTFYARSADILGPLCPLRPLQAEAQAPERNLFSTLFILVSAALGVSEEKLRFYAIVNQGIRTLVTGCDNLLDDEYKETIPFVLPGNAKRFRSVLAVMVADRVLSSLALEAVLSGRLDEEQAQRLSDSVLRILLPSGLEEDEEEAAAALPPMTPEDVLNNVHHRKTGLLFQAPIMLLDAMDELSLKASDPIMAALHALGLGCQLLDDCKDVALDLAGNRPNIVISMAYHGQDAHERATVERILDSPELHYDVSAEDLPLAKAQCLSWSTRHFDTFVSIMSETLNGPPGLAQPIAASIQSAVGKSSLNVTQGVTA